ncbi:MAG: hypothetical protein JMN27_00460 [gamma proteobacterium endosymbiont of Lamellibrachia anaximandri]|nr:hypothetical protein [gamma proteobacterium endosymbiont of Lamellibrachia anaximandri]MBL3532288.1 hypothetical protein [gamma proteobacterium endosymbiont of Lamellibrachia anaximandri]
MRLQRRVMSNVAPFLFAPTVSMRKEPVLYARQAVLTALGRDDFAVAGAVVARNAYAFRHLDREHAPGLMSDLERALKRRDIKGIHLTLQQAVAAELVRCLSAVQENLGHSQDAKHLLMKCSRLFSMLETDLGKKAWDEGRWALQGCQQSIGTMGLFGVGCVEADPERFLRHKQTLMGILQSKGLVR